MLDHVPEPTTTIADLVPPFFSLEEECSVALPPVLEESSPQDPQDDLLIMPPNILTSLATVPEETLPPLPLAVEPVTLDMADDLLVSAKEILTTDPEQSVNHVIRAASIYDQYEQPYPESLYWLLGNAFASLSWGDPLLESSPVIETMSLSPDNRWLLVQLQDKTIWLLDLQSAEHERAAHLLGPGAAEYVKFVFSPDMRWIIGGQRNGTIRIWDMTHNNPAGTTIAFAERVPDLQDLQISPNGEWLAAFGSSPRGAAVAKTPCPSQLELSQLPPNQIVQQAAYQRTDHSDSHGSSSYPVLLWNLRPMEVGIIPMATMVPATSQPVQVIRFSPNSEQIAVGCRDAVVRVYDLLTSGVNDDPFILRGHQLGITQIAFAPSGQWMATGSQDNTVRLWNLASDKESPESATLTGHLGWISTLAIDKAGEYVFSGSYDRTIRIWNVKNDRINTALKEKPIILETNLGIPETLLLTQDGEKMMTLGREGSLGIYHLPTLLGYHTFDDVRAITFRNSRLSISKCVLTSDDQLLIFSFDHLTNASNNGIRLWALRPQAFLQ